MRFGMFDVDMASIAIDVDDYDDIGGGGGGGGVCTNFMMIVQTLVCKIGLRGMRAVITDMSCTRVYGSYQCTVFCLF